MSKTRAVRTLTDSSTSLEIIQQPPSYVPFDTWIDIDIGLIDKTTRASRKNGRSNQHQGSKEKVHDEFIDVHLSVSHSSDIQSDDAEKEDKILPLLTTDVSLPIRLACDNKHSSTKIKLKLTSSDQLANLIGPSFCLSLQPKSITADDDQAHKIEHICTKPFKLASCNLHIQTEGWEDIWYKDEGGREKCMQVSVSLRDNKDNVITNRKLPLKLTLLYQNEQHLKVMRQEILHVFGPAKHEINSNTGTTSIRFRIEDVSKNHQGQNFMVQVEEDSPQYSGVAPAITPSVSIRSKRNKRQRTTSAGKNDGMTSQRLSESPHPLGGIPMSRSPFSNDGGQGGNDFDLMAPLGFRGCAGPREVQKLREAMRGVIKWTEEVVNGLYPLQWQIVGYSPNPDGSFDYNRPYHTMPNPNNCISKILSMYSESTREHLRTLVSAVENTKAESDTRSQLRSSLNNTAMPQDNNHSDMLSMSPPSQRRRPLQPNQTERGNQPNFENQQLGPQFTMQNPYPKQDDYSIFEPPWADQYTPSNTQLENSRNMPYMNQNQVQSNGGMQNNQQQPHMQLDFQRAPVDILGRDNTQINPLPMQTMNPTRIGNLPGHDGEDIDMDDRQAEVAFILAIEYVSMRSGQKLGFPAYTKTNELVGFYRESKVKTGSAMFTSVSRIGHEIGPMEMTQASQILQDYISRKSEAVHAIEDWGTVRNLVDHAMVYDWNNGLGNNRKATNMNSPIRYM